MRLVYPRLNLELMLSRESAAILSLERIEEYRLFIENVIEQYQGGNGSVIISENEKELNFSKSVVFVMNPFEITSNEKRILNKLYGELEQTARAELIEEITDLNARIVSFVDGLSKKTPYPICFSMNPDITGLMKLYQLEIEEDTGSLLERIISYIRSMHQICRQEVFIFINLRTLLNQEELQQLYELCRYEQIFLMIIEGRSCGKHPHEKCCVVDSDLCIIDLSE